MLDPSKMRRIQLRDPSDGNAWSEVSDMGALEPGDVIRFLEQDGSPINGKVYLVDDHPHIKCTEV